MDLASATALPSISVSTPGNPAETSISEEHTTRRMFVGPMPERVISVNEAQVRKHRRLFNIHGISEDDASDASVARVIKDHAFNFFIKQGGKEEDWGENEEQSVTEEMLRRWRASEWGTLWSHRRQKGTRPTSRWVGGSFEIGNIMGLNILQGTTDMTRDRSSMSTSRRDDASVAHPTEDRLDAETYVTAPSTGPQPSTSMQTERLEDNSFFPNPVLPESGDSAADSSPSSSTAKLLRPPLAVNKPQTDVIQRPAATTPAFPAHSDGHLAVLDMNRTRQVHYADDVDVRTPGPAPPAEVLERTGSDVLESSAGATAPSPQPELLWGDVVLRDRMLVRVSYSKSESLSPWFDEIQNRTTRYLQYADWAEFMVAWRKDRIEIYEDYSVPGKEWITGHKHLAFVIPLKSSRTHLSLYSFVDLTFCITCPPTTTRDTSKSRWNFHRAKEGTNVFVFKVKSRSRACDWVWKLWRHMGGQIPKTIEIRNPRLSTKVKIDLPGLDGIDNDRAYRVFSRKNIIALCMESLKSVDDWKTVVERQIMDGKTLELAWRVDTNLDWIWLEDDIDGEPRHWAVLAGLALKQDSSASTFPGDSTHTLARSMRTPVLEIRLAEHYPAYLHLKNGSRLHEPPAIEGYLERIKPNTQIKQQVYLSTHDGNLFILTPARAHPPPPPGLVPIPQDTTDYSKYLRQTEVQRGALQLMDSTGVCDLRDILAVRRAFHVALQPSHIERPKPQDDDIWFNIWSQPEERTPEDDEDAGGEEGLSISNEKAQLRMHRSFELLLKSGRVIRFEAYSRRLAVEWIERLRALVLYWRQRHRIDAREEMDLAHARRARLTPNTHVCGDDHDLAPEPPADPAAPLPALGSLYNWCVLQGCNSIIRGGKVYMRRGLRGQYKLVQLFLIPGHLVQFRITPKSSLHPSMNKKTNLMDAYVCSGYFAALALPKGQYSPTENAAPRRYQDGLEADDPEEDMLFMIWYRPQAPMIESGKNAPLTPQTPTNPKSVPALSAKRKLLVIRTRSRLERDAWCWALNCEIEKVARVQKDREEKLRETGTLLKP